MRIFIDDLAGGVLMRKVTLGPKASLEDGFQQ